jgi:hypothetical protein
MLRSGLTMNDDPGMERLAAGITQLMQSGYPDVPGLLWHLANYMEVRGAKDGFSDVLRAATELRLDGQCAPWVLRQVSAELATQITAQMVRDNPPAPDRTEAANKFVAKLHAGDISAGGADVIDMKTRQHLAKKED